MLNQPLSFLWSTPVISNAGLCLVSSERENPFPEKDMHMVTDLADRVAVVVSHAELFAQVERQAVTDPMTSLFNRRYFTEQLTKEIDRYQRFGHPILLHHRRPRLPEKDQRLARSPLR